MSILNLLYSYFNLASAVGLISTIITLVVILLLNNAVTFFILSLEDVVDNVLGDEIRKSDNEISIGDYKVKDDDILRFLQGSDKTLAYGPQNILAYNTVINTALAIQMIIIGIVYIMSDYNQIYLYKKIMACLNK